MPDLSQTTYGPTAQRHRLETQTTAGAPLSIELRTIKHLPLAASKFLSCESLRIADQDAELWWWAGPAAAAPIASRCSKGYPEAGFYIMRSDTAHVMSHCRSWNAWFGLTFAQRSSKFRVLGRRAVHGSLIPERTFTLQSGRSKLFPVDSRAQHCSNWWSGDQSF